MVSAFTHRGIKPQHIYTDPTDKDIPLWRYMNINKLKSLVETNALHMTRMDVFTDKFEGYVGHANNHAIDEMFKDQIGGNQMASSLKSTLEKHKTVTYVNCWHMNYKEDRHMWDIYNDFEVGVAIKTTGERLQSSILPTDQGILQMRPVVYTDVLDDVIATSPFDLLLVKQSKFSIENEYRLSMLYAMGEVSHDFNEIAIKAPEEGIKLRVDLRTLIEDIYIHPLATEDDFLLLGRLVRMYLGLELKRSALTITY